MAAGRRVALPWADTQRTIADGLRAPSLGEITWPHVRDLVDSIVTVEESEICAAVRALATSSRLVVEPSGAVAAAALLSDASRLPGGRTVVVLSGGNVDPGWFSRTLAGSTL
jgi:threonine dehydratase